MGRRRVPSEVKKSFKHGHCWNTNDHRHRSNPQRSASYLLSWWRYGIRSICITQIWIRLGSGVQWTVFKNDCVVLRISLMLRQSPLTQSVVLKRDDQQHWWSRQQAQEWLEPICTIWLVAFTSHQSHCTSQSSPQRELESNVAVEHLRVSTLKRHWTR
jgi:hypothetical protein